MTYPAMVQYVDLEDYRAHFERVYCANPVSTHDGIAVRFRKNKFDHCMFKTDRRTREKTATACPERLKRIDWIKAALQDAAAPMRQGWDNKRRIHVQDRRVSLVYKECYLVVIALKGQHEADFMTAYPIDAATVQTIFQKAPPWKIRT